MKRIAHALFGLLVSIAACTRTPTPAVQTTVAWQDPSPHEVRFIEIAPGVKVEVLDWGGTGSPLMFISGLQDVAHGFDDFAPRFTDTHHVLAMTRRGYGASSQPASGYGVETRVADLRTLLDSLQLTRVTLVGHSIAGDELTGFAARYPDRVAGLVYLDAAYDHSGVAALLGEYPPPPPMLPADSASPAAVQAYQKRVFGMLIPEAQLRAIARYDERGHLVADVTPASIDAAVISGCGHPDYASVQAPALVINSVADSAPDVFAAWGAMDSASHAKGQRFFQAISAFGTTERARTRAGLKHATFLDLHGANHYVFDSNGAEVEKAMRTFLAGMR